jgi:ubiquinone/menaquinone biosynthesis C-methylase UbiE
MDKQAINISVFETEEALEGCSLYRLFPAERALFRKYYKPGQSVLDLACGAGRTTLRLHEMGLSVKGIDTSERLISVAKRRFPYLDFELGSYVRTNEPSGSYDHTLISFNGLDYAHPEANRLAGIRECLRVVKEGGTFIFSSHNIKSLHASPVYLLHGQIFLQLRHTLTAFQEQAYVYEPAVKTYTFFGSPRYVIRQVEWEGFSLIDMIGVRNTRNRWLNQYAAPYIHYAFRKGSRVPFSQPKVS